MCSAHHNRVHGLTQIIVIGCNEAKNSEISLENHKFASKDRKHADFSKHSIIFLIVLQNVQFL